MSPGAAPGRSPNPRRQMPVRRPQTLLASATLTGLPNHPERRSNVGRPGSQMFRRHLINTLIYRKAIYFVPLNMRRCAPLFFVFSPARKSQHDGALSARQSVEALDAVQGAQLALAFWRLPRCHISHVRLGSGTPGYPTRYGWLHRVYRSRDELRRDLGVTDRTQIFRKVCF